MSFSLKLWERIRALGIVNTIFDAVDRWHERGVVLYKTDWRTNKIESLVAYLKRQMKSTYAEALVSENIDFIGPFDEDYSALFWLRWIINNITYKSDKDKFGVAEVWEDIDHVLATRECDCESGATLLYVLLRLSGVPRRRLRLYGGDIETNSPSKGHVWLQYRSYYDGMWKILDWCYDANTTPIPKRIWAYNKARYLDRWWGFDEIKHYRGWR